ncbi:MAG: PKD domain-containing protein [Candidatus Cloacimonetes bacterium]|nr:PKD domain-containing protein [Candidatus Cloacimonadota bacterium]
MVQFSDESSQGTGNIQQWLWDFGDGNTSAVQNPDHTYILPGTYTVNLTVTNAYDSTSVMIKEQYITVIQPIAELTLTSSESLSFGSVFVEESSGYLPITVSSNGGASVTITSVHFMGDPLHFELLDPFRDLVVEHGETDTLWVRFAPQTVGAIIDTLYIVNDSVNEPLLKVKLTGTGLYVLPQAPQSPTITVVGNNVHLSWEAVTLNMHDQPITPDYYFVYISDDPYEGFVLTALTPDLSYAHPLITIGAERMFYRITAVKFYRKETDPAEDDRIVRDTFMPEMSEREVREALQGLINSDFH